MKRALFGSIVGLALGYGIFACGEMPPPDVAPVTPPPAPAATQVAAVVPTGAPSAIATVAKPVDPPKPTAPAAVLAFKEVGLMTPESVLHDTTDDVYLVSNIEGKPTDADGKAFISRLSPDGKVIALKWIEGGKNKAKLNAPKGLAIVGEDLYVADLDTVRIFNRKTGAPKKDIAVKGATFLNDVAPDGQGGVYVTDSGMKLGKEGFEGTGTDAVHAIDAKGNVRAVAKSADLKRPNGVAVAGPFVVVAPFGSSDLFTLSPKTGAMMPYGKAPKGMLDGVVVVGDDMLVSSWESNAIYRVAAPTVERKIEFKEIIANVTSPADIGFDAKRNRVLVPLFTKDVIEIYDLK